MPDSVDKHSLDFLLPVIRCFPASWTTSLDHLQDGVAVYHDRFGFFQTKRPHKLPEKLWDTDGWKYLFGTAAVRNVEIVPASDISQIQLSKPRLFGCWWLGSREEGPELRVYLRDGRGGRWFVPESDANGLRVALSILCGDRFVDNATLSPWSPTAGRLERRVVSPALCGRLLALVILVVTWFPCAIAGDWAAPWAPEQWVSDLRSAIHAPEQGIDSHGNPTWEITYEEDSPASFVAGQLSQAYFSGQGAIALPKLAIVLAAFPGAMAIILWTWATGVVLLTPLQLWSNARARQTDLRRRSQRERATSRKKTSSSRRRPLPLLWLGYGLKLAGALAIALGFLWISILIIFSPIYYQDPCAREIAGDSGRWGVLLIAVPLIYFGHRLARRDGRRALARDNRAPVVYLRPFAADGRNNFNPSGLLAQLLGLSPYGLLRVIGPFGNLNPLRLARLLFDRAGEHAEEQMAQFFRRFGPSVAVGRPGELLSQTGAIRIMADGEWRMTVEELLSRAGMVVVQPSDSDGIRWEIERVFLTVPLQKVLLCLLLFDRRQGRYDEFRAWVHARTGVKLPRSLGDTAFIFFDSDGQAKPLRLSEHLPIFWPTLSCVVNFEQTLAPFLVVTNGDALKRLIRPPNRRFRALWSIAALSCWSAVMTLPWAFVDSLGEKLRVHTRQTGERVYQSNSSRWRWRLNESWTRRSSPPPNRTAQFDRGDTTRIYLMTGEFKPYPDSPESVINDWEHLQISNNTLIGLSSKEVKAGGLQWLEREYRGITESGDTRFVVRASVACNRRLVVAGEFKGDDEPEYHQVIEALKGFTWCVGWRQAARKRGWCEPGCIGLVLFNEDTNGLSARRLQRCIPNSLEFSRRARMIISKKRQYQDSASIREPGRCRPEFCDETG